MQGRARRNRDWFRGQTNSETSVVRVIGMSPKQSLNRRRLLEESDRADRPPGFAARLERLRRLQRLPFRLSSSQRAVYPDSGGNAVKGNVRCRH